MSKITRTAARTGFLALVDSLRTVDAARQSAHDAESALSAAWSTNGDAATAYILSVFGDDLPAKGRPSDDSRESQGQTVALADMGATLPDEPTDDDKRAYDAARQYIRRIRWTVLLHAATGADWSECGTVARSATHARTLVERARTGADVTVVTGEGDAAKVTLPRPTRTPSTVSATTDTTVTPHAPTDPTPVDIAVETVAAATDRAMADTLHGIADRVARALPVDPAVRVAMVADARAILAALGAEVTA